MKTKETNVWAKIGTVSIWAKDWDDYKRELAVAAYAQLHQDIRAGNWRPIEELLTAIPAIDLGNYIAEEKLNEIQARWVERLVV